MSQRIYMDNAATTRVRPEVFEEMKAYFTEEYGNPSSAYTFAGKIFQKVEDARELIAKSIGATAREIYFTGGGSESDNWAIKGVADAMKEKGNHIITSKIEHHAVLHTCEFLEKHGFEVTYLDVDENGFVSPEDVKNAIRPETVLISIMFANNEIGTIEPIAEIGKIAHEAGVYFHTDAVQAFGHVSINVDELNIDMLSASGHKLGGPKGIGLLYIRKGVKISNLIHGGAQERGKRGGTTNAAGVMGFAKAVELANKEMEENIAYESKLRDRLIEGIEKEIPYARINGDRKARLSNNVNACFRFIEGESLLIMLDQKGICASSGSACTSGSLDPSHVLLAIGLPHEIAHGSLRISLGHDNSIDDVDYIISVLPPIVEKLRKMSPLWNK